MVKDVSRRGVWGEIVHARGRVTIDPRIPCYAGPDHVGLSPTRPTLLAPRAKRREVSGEPHEG